jgi:alkaline phosphatase D
MNRRNFLSQATKAGSGLVLAPAIITAAQARPQLPCGVQSGDITSNSAILWSRSDRAARMIVEYATTESFTNAQKIIGPAALESSDFTARLDLQNLPAGQRIFYRVSWQDLRDLRVFSEPLSGSFKTAPVNARDVSFVWGGDVCGQGWGINPDFGGMKIYDAMHRLQPDFFVHSGDTIYADGEIKAEVKLDDGTLWKNIVTPEKSKVAETLAEFRGNHRYNLLDENLRRFNSQVPMLAQWDDHEVRNNWYPGQLLDDPKYTVKSVDLLAARGRRAFLEYVPLRFDPLDPERVYRAYNYGPLLDVLMLDERSYRGRNTPNNQTTMSEDTQFLGSTQINWLKQRLASSRATWKVMASDMPLGLIVKDGKENFEAVAQSNGPARGRELEIAELLRFIKHRKLKNVVWITADVHYCAAHYYDPSKAQFTDFAPFWEFVAGPLNAGTFGPGEMDNTFGPNVKFVGIPQGMKANRSPKDGFQFFGAIKINGKTKAMTVSLYNLTGARLFTVELPSER